ncbi:MAG TPA: DUF11 domain-containing protein [Candidatus Xenobia bacterium]|nr:DUF11 domain-containing protein [Candidatus Xenobia bacterium]
MPTALLSRKHLATLLMGAALLALPAVAAEPGLPLYTVSLADNQLRSVDPLTGRTLSRVALTLGGAALEAASGLARHPQTGEIFALVRVAGQIGDELVVLDPASGAATARGNTGDRFAALFFAPDGMLYAVSSATATTPDTVFLLNPADGSAQPASQTEPVERLRARPAAAGRNRPSTPWRGDFILAVNEEQELLLVNAQGEARLGRLDHAASALLLAGDAPACSTRAALFGAAHLDAASLFYSIDPASGAATLVGPIGFDEVTAMDFGSARRLYAIGQRGDTSYLLTIDPCTGLGTEVAAMGLAGGESIADLSYRKSDRTLFALLEAPNELASVDTTTGALTRLGRVAAGGDGLATERSDELLHAADSTLWRVNPASLAEAIVAPLATAGESSRLASLDFLPTGELLALVQASPRESFLAEIDPTSGAMNFLGPTQPGLVALATIDADPDLVLSMTESPDPVPVSTNLVYTLTVANAGPDQATNVVLTDTLPVDSTFQNSAAGQGSCSHSMGVVTCTIGTIASAASVTTTITIRPTMVGSITNNASVTLTEVDPDTTNNSKMVATDVVDFAISVMPASVTVNQGESASYTVTLTPVGGRFDNAVGLSCMDPPVGVTCGFSPSSLAPGGVTVTATLTVRTTASSSSIPPSGPPPAPPVFLWLLAAAALLSWLMARRVAPQRPRFATACALLALLLLVSLQVACSSTEETPPPSPPAGTPRGTHTLTVRGAFSTLEHTATTMLVVQ